MGKKLLNPNIIPDPWHNAEARTLSHAVYPLVPKTTLCHLLPSPTPGFRLSPTWFGLPVVIYRCLLSGSEHQKVSLTTFLLPKIFACWGVKAGSHLFPLRLLNFLLNLALILKWFRYFQKKTKPPLGKNRQRWPISHSRLLWKTPWNVQIPFSSRTTSTSTSNIIIQYKKSNLIAH